MTLPEKPEPKDPRQKLITSITAYRRGMVSLGYVEQDVDAYALAVLEAAAMLCDDETKIAHGEFGAGWVEGARVCAAAIRSLAASTKEG